MSNVALFWMCRACKEDRPEAWISVAKRRVVVDGTVPVGTTLVPMDPIDLTVCYCNDRPRCFQEMPRILDAMARCIIDGLIAPRVHILWQGLAVCDPNKRIIEDFPAGTKWVDASQRLAPFDEVTCELCRARSAHVTPPRE